MLCSKIYHKIGFGTLLSVFFVAFAVFFFFGTDVSAVSDISYTIDTNNKSSDYVFCSDCSSDYNYIYVHPSAFPLSNFNGFYSLHLYLSGRIDYSVPIGGISGILLDFSDDFPSSVQYTYRTALNPFFSSPFNGSITITLSESNPFGSVSSGTLSITENGTYDVTQYAEAVVDVPLVVEPGDYHDDLISIQQAIYVCGAILLVLYFFYCIYRIIIKTTGSYL